MLKQAPMKTPIVLVVFVRCLQLVNVVSLLFSSTIPKPWKMSYIALPVLSVKHSFVTTVVSVSVTARPLVIFVVLVTGSTISRVLNAMKYAQMRTTPKMDIAEIVLNRATMGLSITIALSPISIFVSMMEKKPNDFME
jgi:Na+-transporting NADH:ubiquinone oxidoreductase subunit NqrE